MSSGVKECYRLDMSVALGLALSGGRDEMTLLLMLSLFYLLFFVQHVPKTFANFSAF